jgi:hypothetical protein
MKSFGCLNFFIFIIIYSHLSFANSHEEDHNLIEEETIDVVQEKIPDQDEKNLKIFNVIAQPANPIEQPKSRLPPAPVKKPKPEQEENKLVGFLQKIMILTISLIPLIIIFGKKIQRNLFSSNNNNDDFKNTPLFNKALGSFRALKQYSLSTSKDKNFIEKNQLKMVSIILNGIFEESLEKEIIGNIKKNKENLQKIDFSKGNINTDDKLLKLIFIQFLDGAFNLKTQFDGFSSIDECLQKYDHWQWIFAMFENFPFDLNQTNNNILSITESLKKSPIFILMNALITMIRNESQIIDDNNRNLVKEFLKTIQKNKIFYSDNLLITLNINGVFPKEPNKLENLIITNIFQNIKQLKETKEAIKQLLQNLINVIKQYTNSLGTANDLTWKNNHIESTPSLKIKLDFK